MNAIAHKDTYASEGTDLYSILGEPGEASSSWSELRCAQLSGYDYIFLSNHVNSKLANKTSLSEFVLDLYQVMETSSERAKIYIYSENSVGKPEFASFGLTYDKGQVKDFRITPIKNIAQKEFIRTLFDHSGMLVGSA